MINLKHILSKIIKPLDMEKGSLILIIASFFSYLFGFFRDIIFVNYFGATNVSDSYFLAFRIPDMILNFLVLGFISGALVPIFKSLEKNKQESQNFFNSFLTLVILTTVVVSIFCFIFSNFLITSFFGEKIVNGQVMFRSSEELKIISDMTKVLLLSPIIFGISNTLGMILLSKKKYLSMAISPVLYNIGIILGVIFLSKFFGIYSVAIGAICGAFFHLLIRFLDFRSINISYKINIKITESIKKSFILGLPKVLGLIAFQLVFLIFDIKFSYIQEGAVSAWNYAKNIQSMPISLFGITISMSMLPFLCEAKTNLQKNSVFLKSIIQVCCMVIPASIGLFFVADMLLEVFFQHGAFDLNAKEITLLMLKILSFAIFFESLTHVFSRGFVSQEQTIIPAIGKFIFLFSNIFIIYLFLKEDISILLFSYVFSSILEFIFLLVFFNYKIFKIDIKNYKLSFIKIIFSNIIFSIFLVLLSFLNFNSLLKLIIIVFFGGFFYLLILKILNIKEINDFYKLIFRK